MTKNLKAIWADKDFVSFMRSAYPFERSDRSRTIRIKEQLERMSFGKKGSIVDFIYIIAVIFIIFFIVAIVGLFYSKTNDVVQDMDFMPTEAKAVSSQMSSAYPKQMDNAMALFFFGTLIITLILASLVRVHWIFIPIYLVAIVFLVVQAGIISHIYSTMAQNEMLGPEIAKYTNMAAIFNYLPWIVFIFSLVLMFVMYKVFPTGAQQ